MTLPKVIRIFFALELAPAPQAKLGEYIALLKKRSRSRYIRWAKLENLHITLQFLGKFNSEDFGALISNVRSRIENVTPSAHVTFERTNLFPSPFRPRVIVLEVTPQDTIAQLAAQIGEGIVATGYPIDERPFRAHLTLGRIKQPQGTDLHFLNETPIPQLEVIPIKEVIIFRSEPGQLGSKYTPLAVLPLQPQTSRHESSVTRGRLSGVE